MAAPHAQNYRKSIRAALRNKKLADSFVDSIHDLQVFAAANGGTIDTKILDSAITRSTESPYKLTSTPRWGEENISDMRKGMRAALNNKKLADEMLNILLELQDYTTSADKQTTSVDVIADVSAKQITDILCTADTGGVKEITDILAVADTGGVKEITDILCVADTGGVQNITEIIGIADTGGTKQVTTITADTRTNTADGQYFDIDAASTTTPRRIYMDTTGGDLVQPAAGGRTLVRVDISGGADTAANVGDLVAGVLDGLADFACPATGTGVVVCTDANFGACVAPANGDLTGLWTIANTTPGVASNLDGKYFVIYDKAGSVGVWFDTDNKGLSAPAACVSATDRQIEVNFADSAINTVVADAVYDKLVLDSEFGAGGKGGTPTITLLDAKYGARTAGDAATSGFTVNSNGAGGSTAGVDSSLDGKYFILQDKAGSVAFWIDVDNDGTTVPAHGADRAVEITTITTGMAIGAVGTAVYNAVIGDSEFAAGTDDAAGALTVVDAKYGARSAASAGDSGFTVGENTTGVDSSLDGKYFTLQDGAGSVAFWIDVDNDGTAAPVHGADRAVEITTISTGDVIGTVGTAVYTAVVADSKFEAGSDDLAGNLTIQNAEFGPRAAASAGTSGFTVGENTAGTGLDRAYFLLEDVAGTVAFWIDIDDSGSTIPAGASAADRAVEITTISNGDVIGDVGTLVYTAVVADSKFEAGSDDLAGGLIIQHVDTGYYGSVGAGTSGFTVAVLDAGSPIDTPDKMVTQSITPGAVPYATSNTKALTSSLNHAALASDILAMILELQTEFRDGQLGTCTGTLTNDLITL